MRCRNRDSVPDGRGIDDFNGLNISNDQFIQCPPGLASQQHRRQSSGNLN
jgi:hypothetical protein